ncbi:MAG: diguanylate cyclase, partial [Campylobacterota bacterium]|nr:diguanylate cyclase [Campylobacterota bacterium]
TLKSNDKTEDIPVIFITAKTDEDSIVKAYDIGGIDYITKPFKSRELLARVKRELKMQNLIHDLEESKEELRLLASIDPLTKLYNRRYFSKASEHIFYLSKRNNSTLSIIMLDIDNFKKINDTYGHQVGDDVLVTIASALQGFIRKSDIVCRFGGEEFLMLFPQTPIDKALLISEKIRLKIEDTVVSLENKKELKFTASIGVSQINHEKDKSIEDMIKRADDALYEAKNSGRNRICKNINK